MKRAIAGILLLVGMGVAPALAWDGDRGLHRDIRHDQAKIAHDRRELRRDLYGGDYAAARHERRELRREEPRRQSRSPRPLLGPSLTSNSCLGEISSGRDWRHIRRRSRLLFPGAEVRTTCFRSLERTSPVPRRSVRGFSSCHRIQLSSRPSRAIMPHRFCVVSLG
jgi:hypothetical protein